MSGLWLKLWRDLKLNWGQFFAVVIVIALGSAFFVASFCSYQGVKDSLEKTYSELKFPQSWVTFEGQGPAVVPEGVELRHSAQVALEFKQGERTGALAIGLPPGGPVFSKLKLYSGALPGEGQVLLEASFAKFHGLKLGETLGIKVGEKTYNWVVAGIAGSPEYIWPVADRYVPSPSPRNFGVIYIPEKQLFRDLAGINHELLMFGTDLRKVMTDLQSQNVIIKEVYARDQQPSNQILTLMISGFGKVTAVLPWFFLLSAALASFALTNVLVKAQRSQIQTLHCLGFSRLQLILHYLAFGLVAGITGSVAGGILGLILAAKLTGSLAAIIGLPFVVNHIQKDILVAAALCNTLAAVAGGLAPALQRPKEPRMNKVRGWQRFIPVMLRLPFNNLLRELKGSAFGVAVIGLGVSLVVVGVILYTSVAGSADKQFNSFQAYDLKVQFRDVLKPEVVDDIANLPGVIAVNPLYNLPIMVSYNQRQVPTLLTGTRGDMLRLENRLGQPMDLTGLYLSDGVKQSLGARWAPKVDITSLVGRKSEVSVKGYVRWHFGNQIFAPLEVVQSLAGKKGINGVYLRVKPEELEQVRLRLYRYPTILQVDSPQENYEDQKILVNFTYFYLRILIFFGVVLAGSMIFATARVNMLSRSREYVTMRILGVGLRKIGLSVFLEYLFLLLGGLALGVLGGTALAAYLLDKVNGELVYSSLIFDQKTFVLIVLVSILIIPAAVISALQTIQKLNLTENTRELN